MVTIIGPSGTGKSTIADAFGFLADCLEKGVEEACDMGNRGGFKQLISQGNEKVIRFELYYREIGYVFEGTDGWQDDEGNITGRGRRVEVCLADKRKLGIATYGAMSQYNRIVDFMNFLKSWYLCYFSPDSARQIQMAAPQPYLNRTGSNLNNVAQYMYRENPTAFKAILKDIQTKLQGIIAIEPKYMENGQMVLRFQEKGFQYPFYSPHMSDGILKLFAYYLLLHEHSPRQLVFIEEPENGLYHHYLTDLASEMRKNVGSGFAKQLFVTTHSPFFVNALAPDDVWVLEKEANGFSSIKRAAEYEFVKKKCREKIFFLAIYGTVNTLDKEIFL